MYNIYIIYICIYIYEVFILRFSIPYIKLARVGLEPTTAYLPCIRSNH